MILNCPECNARYVVPDVAISSGGRKVRCANCGHSWHVDTHAKTPAQTSKTPPVVSSSSFSLPVSASTMSSPERIAPPAMISDNAISHSAIRKLKVACALLLVCAILITPFVYRKAIMQSHPELTVLFERIGISDLDGLSIADVTLGKASLGENKGMRYTIDCGVINESRGSRTLPKLTIALLREDGQEIKQSPNLIETGKNIKSGELQPCKTFTFESKEGEIERARIDLADPFDLFLRRKQ